MVESEACNCRTSYRQELNRLLPYAGLAAVSKDATFCANFWRLDFYVLFVSGNWFWRKRGITSFANTDIFGVTCIFAFSNLRYISFSQLCRRDISCNYTALLIVPDVEKGRVSGSFLSRLFFSIAFLVKLMSFAPS